MSKRKERLEFRVTKIEERIVEATDKGQTIRVESLNKRLTEVKAKLAAV